ncbi:hypothetical protein HFN89_00170 [Rhizobium laguerreae]|nr:hypothetical protein [Rhizobium laguerreae]
MLIMPGNSQEGFISVKSLADARRDWAGFDHVITIEDAGFGEGLRLPSGAKTTQTVLQFDDTDLTQGRGRAATHDEVRLLLMKGREHTTSKLLVHCHQGQSRSAAVALGVISDRLGKGRESEAVVALLAIRPTAVCNSLVLRHADDLLGRAGALVREWESHLANDDRAAGVMLLRRLAETTLE